FALNAGGDAHLLCAGTHGEITGEDALFAGAVVDHVTQRRLENDGASVPPNSPTDAVQRGLTNSPRNDQAYLTELAWQNLVGCSRASSPAALCDHLAHYTRGGRNVSGLGLSADILDAATIDRFDFAPELRLSEWHVVR